MVASEAGAGAGASAAATPFIPESDIIMITNIAATSIFIFIAASICDGRIQRNEGSAALWNKFLCED